MMCGVVAALIVSTHGVEAQELASVSNLSDAEKVAFAELIGRQIYNTRSVREVAQKELDAFRGESAGPQYSNATWVVTSFGTNWKVALVDSSDGQSVVRYQIHVDKSGDVVPDTFEEFVDGAAPDEFQVAKLNALKTAAGVPYRACTRTHEVVAIEDQTPSSAGGYTVYLLAVPDEDYVYQLGRHFRVQIDRSGEKILNVSKLSDSCFQIRPGDGFDREHPEHSTYLVRHPEKTAPDEVDVYLNLSMGLPLVIYTKPSFTTWNIEGGEIEVFGW